MYQAESSTSRTSRQREITCRCTRAPGGRSGNARIEGTRVAADDVIGLLQTGETVDSLMARCSPDLTRAQVYECLAFFSEDHRGEIDVLAARQMPPRSRNLLVR